MLFARVRSLSGQSSFVVVRFSASAGHQIFSGIAPLSVIDQFALSSFSRRLQVVGTQFPANLTAGATFGVAVALKNYGFAAPINRRPVYLAIVRQDVAWYAQHERCLS